MNSGIYKIINKINRKYYIGSSNNLKRRWAVHKFYLNNNNHHNLHLQNAWNKYGCSNFKFIILEKIPERKLLEVEQKYLDEVKLKQKKCYNLSFLAGRVEMTVDVKLKISKSMTGRKFSEDHKRKIGNIHRGKIISKETRKKMKLAKLGVNHPMFGKHHSDETKKKMSINNARSMLGKHPSQKTRLKMGKSKMGNKNPNFKGKYKGNKHPLYDFSVYNFINKVTNEKFDGTKYNFIKKYKLHQSSVSRLISGKYKSTENWILMN